MCTIFENLPSNRKLTDRSIILPSNCSTGNPNLIFPWDDEVTGSGRRDTRVTLQPEQLARAKHSVAPAPRCELRVMTSGLRPASNTILTSPSFNKLKFGRNMQTEPTRQPRRAESMGVFSNIVSVPLFASVAPGGDQPGHISCLSLYLRHQQKTPPNRTKQPSETSDLIQRAVPSPVQRH